MRPPNSPTHTPNPDYGYFGVEGGNCSSCVPEGSRGVPPLRDHRAATAFSSLVLTCAILKFPKFCVEVQDWHFKGSKYSRREAASIVAGKQQV